MSITPNSSSTPTTSKLSLVCTLTNVYNQFSFKLTLDGSRYKLRRQIFSNMCHGTLCYGHISNKSEPTGDDDEEWYSVDARIKSWFYSTCDSSLLQIIYSDECTAKILWDKLEDFFSKQ